MTHPENLSSVEPRTLRDRFARNQPTRLRGSAVGLGYFRTINSREASVIIRG